MGDLHDGAVDHRYLDVGLRVTKSRAGAAVDRWIFFVLQEVVRKGKTKYFEEEQNFLRKSKMF